MAAHRFSMPSKIEPSEPTWRDWGPSLVAGAGAEAAGAGAAGAGAAGAGAEELDPVLTSPPVEDLPDDVEPVSDATALEVAGWFWAWVGLADDQEWW